jgi:predicted nucleic acid-binding protein
VGSLILPTSGFIYADAQAIIYGVEHHPTYSPLLRPLWSAVQAGSLTLVTSDLSVLEALVLPLRTGDTVLELEYEGFFDQAGIDLVPMTRPLLKSAARLRATVPGLRTPDAIHAASALTSGCRLFVTNDRGFNRVSGLSLVMLDELLSA